MTETLKLIPTLLGLDDFQKELHPFSLNERSLSNGRVNIAPAAVAVAAARKYTNLVLIKARSKRPVPTDARCIYYFLKALWKVMHMSSGLH